MMCKTNDRLKHSTLTISECHPTNPKAAPPALIRQAVTAWLTKELAKDPRAESERSGN